MKKNMLLRCACALAVLSAVAIPVSAGSIKDKFGSFKESLKKNSQKDDKSAKSSKTNSKYKREPVDEAVWDLSALDTARDAEYMDEIEKDIILEMNMARSNPKKYAEMYIEPRIKKFKGKLYGGILQTNEGADVVSECVKFMGSQKSLPVLVPSRGLTQAAKDHADTQSLAGQTGHTGTDGSDPFTRMKRYGSYTGASGENISYGSKTAREIVVTLLIDDGVKSRGHRKNIMSKDYTAAGVGFAGQHKLYGCECVLDFAANYKEKE